MDVCTVKGDIDVWGKLPNFWSYVWKNNFLCKELWLGISVRDSMLGCSNISTGPLHGPMAFLEHPPSPNCTWVVGYKLSQSALKHTGSMLWCGYMKHCVLFLRVHLGTFFFFTWSFLPKNTNHSGIMWEACLLIYKCWHLQLMNVGGDRQVWNCL